MSGGAGWDEQMIAAYIDGAIEDEAERARLARLIETDPDAGALAARLRRSNAMLREAFDAPMNEPVPPAIAALFEQAGDEASPRPQSSGRVIAFPQHLRRVALPAALAASIAAGLFIGMQLDDRPAPGSGPSQLVGLGIGDGTGRVDRALETLPSGSVSADGIRPMLSFRAGDGRACREFEVVGALPSALELGIACRTPSGGWDVKILVAAPPAEDAGDGTIVPAAGPPVEALDAVLDALDAGPTMGPAEEARLLSEGWRAGD